MNKTKTTPLAFALALSLAMNAYAVQPWEEQQKMQQQGQDPEKFSRPTADTLKGEEIKEFRDQLNAVKQQIFRDGGVPAGAAFRSEVKDGSAGPVYQAEARFNQFTPAMQSQISSRLPGAAESSQNILIELPAQSEIMSVSSARFTDAQSTLLKRPDPLQMNPISQPQIPSSLPTTPPVQNPGARVGVMPTGVPAQPAQAPESKSGINPAGVPSAQPNSQNARPTITSLSQNTAARPLGKTEYARPHMSDVGLLVSQERGQIRMETRPVTVSPTLQPVAVLPLASGGELFVQAVTQTLDADILLEVRGAVNALPDGLKSQIDTDQPGSLSKMQPTQEVVVMAALKPDNSLKVQAVQPAATPVAQEAKTVLRSAEPAVLLTQARVLGEILGIKSEDVRIEKRPVSGKEETKQASMAVVALEKGGTVIIFETGSSQSSQPPRYTAEVRVKDLSPEMKTKMEQKLKEFGAAALLTEEAHVAVEVEITSEKLYDITAISLINATAPEEQREMVLWKEDSAFVESAQPTTLGPSSQPQVPAVTVAEQPVAHGLTPAVSQLLTQAFGLAPAQVEIRDAHAQGNVRVQIPSQKRVLPMSFTRPSRAGAYEFTVQSKVLDFTDAIREQVYAQLKEAVEKGDSWAKDALAGSKDLVVQFEVPEEGAREGNKIRVKSVSPTVRDQTQEIAQDMGLAQGDYLLVNVGGRTLLVLEKGVTALAKAGEKVLKIKSVDGDAKIVLKQDRTKNDQSILLMMSKKSLKDNRGNIEDIFDGAGKIIDQAIKKNPQDEQFFIRLDPQTEEVAVVKSLSELEHK